MVFTAAAATSPWWLGPAINTTGIGLIMLQDYLNRNNSSLSNQVGINEPIQWRDGSVGGIDSSSSYLDQAANLPVTADVSTVVPQTTVQESIDQNIRRNEAVSEDRDQIADALTKKYVSDLAADNAVTAETDVASTPPPTEDPNKNISGTARWTAATELINNLSNLIPGQNGDVITDANRAQTEKSLEKYGFDEGFTLKSDGSVVRSDAGKKADNFLAMKKAWLEKTANSPAAQAGHSDDARWGVYLGNQAWRKDRGRGYNTALDPYLKPSSENQRRWNVFGNEMVFDK